MLQLDSEKEATLIELGLSSYSRLQLSKKLITILLKVIRDVLFYYVAFSEMLLVQHKEVHA